MKSKRATKEAGTRISCIATAIEANTHEILSINFARPTNLRPAAGVIPVPLASSVIWVVTQSCEPGWARCR